MATTYTIMRLQLKMGSMGKIPITHIGSAGILYSSPLMERERSSYRLSAVQTTSSPEFVGANRMLVKKGAMGGYNNWRYYSTSTSVDDVKKAEKEREGKKKFKLKTAETVKVLLLSETGSVSSVTLDEAKSIAKKKRLELEQIVKDQDKPFRSEKVQYKLVSKLKSFSEDDVAVASDSESNKKSKVKDQYQKTVFLNGGIAEHDLNSKLNQMQKWVTKGLSIRVIIVGQSGTTGDAETVYKAIESKMKEVEGIIHQKVAKGKEIKFFIVPPKTKTNKLPTEKVKAPLNSEPENDNKDFSYDKYLEQTIKNT